MIILKGSGERVIKLIQNAMEDAQMLGGNLQMQRV
jgi:hypothetical protein